MPIGKETESLEDLYRQVRREMEEVDKIVREPLSLQDMMFQANESWTRRATCAEKVLELFKSLEGPIRSARDAYYVAYITLHGGTSAGAYTYALLAHRLGFKPEEDEEPALTIAAQAWDRSKIEAGLPQDFGTQWRSVTEANVKFRNLTLQHFHPNTPFLQAPVNADFTDGKRAAFGIPPLADQRPPDE